MRKKIATLAVVFLVVSSAIGAATLTCSEPSMGIKRGNWIEYKVIIGGTPPPIHNVNWLKIEILNVQGDTFDADFCVKYPNGTLLSTTWQFNFTEGNTEGWIIIPSNLSPGNTFCDLFRSITSNITIQGQMHKTVGGATRTIIYANDSLRTKEWDKATGVFTNSSETFKNWSAYVYLTTNMWSPQILGLSQTVFYVVLAASVVLAVTMVFSVVIVVRRKRLRAKSA